MALGDYILCCKCEVKLIYDGNRSQREWWEERFGKPPQIECPDCKPKREPLTNEEIDEKWRKATELPALTSQFVRAFARAVEAAHGIKEKNN